MQKLTLVLLPIMAGFLAIFMLIQLFAVIGHLIAGENFNQSNQAWGIVAPLGMLGFMLALTVFCRFLARNEAAFIRAFLLRILDGKEEAGRG